MANWKFYLDGNEVEEPIGWDAIEFTALRMESHGIDQPFSTEVRFYNQGAKYIKSIYDQYFINQPIAIQITSDVGYNGTPFVFDGFLNMAIYQEHNVCDTDSWEITVGIIDDNFRESFKARQDVEINLRDNKDVEGNAIAPAEWESIRLHKSDIYLSASGRNLDFATLYLEYNSNDVVAPYDWVFPDYIKIFPVYWSNSDFVNPVGSTVDVTGLTYTTTNAIFSNNTSYTRTIKFAGTVNGRWRVTNRTCGGTSNWDAYILVQDTTGVTQTYYPVYTSPVVGNGTIPTPTFYDYDFSFSVDVVVDPNYVVLFGAWWGTGGTIQREVPTGTFPLPFLCQGDTIIGVDNLCITASELNTGEYASFCDVLRVENYLNQIIYKLTGSNNKLISDTFSQASHGCYWNNAVTNGLRIRNAVTITQTEVGCGDTPEDNQNIFNTTWKKAFESLDKIFCLGWAFEWTGLEWKIRVESRDYFYQNLVSQTFEHVGEINQMAKSEMLVNNVIIGYSDNWKNRDIGGAWAINTQRNYFIGNRALNENSTNSLDLRTEFIAEGYAIEFSRRLQFYQPGAISSDRPNDYDTFIIWLNRFELSGSAVQNTPFRLQNETGAYAFAPGTVSMPSDYITASNSPMNGLYNIYHTPARIACRWWKVLGMHTYGLTNPVMKFQTGEYQITYSSTIDGTSEKAACIEVAGGAIAETSNISAAILNPAYQQYLFKPIGVEFSYPQSLCDFLTLSQDEQYKKVRLTSGSLVIEGFIMEATNQPEDASGGTTKFNLIVSAQQSEPGGAFDTGFNSGYDIEN
jgi:hypothetical protein